MAVRPHVFKDRESFDPDSEDVFGHNRPDPGMHLIKGAYEGSWAVSLLV